MKKFYYSVKDGYYVVKDWVTATYQTRRDGFAKRDLWSLDHTITDFVLPRLRAFRNGEANPNTDGPTSCPVLPGYDEEKMGDAENDAMYEEWLEILDKMIVAFEYHKLDMDDVNSNVLTPEDNKWVSLNNYKQEEERRGEMMKEGFALFAQYYRSLWD